MAARSFEIARGRIIELAQRVVDADGTDPEFFIAYYKGTIESDALLEGRADKTAVDANNTICDFTNYGTDASRALANVSRGITTGEAWCDSDNMTITNAGGTTDNTITRAILYYADNIASTGTAIPLVHFQFDVTTSGINLTFAPGSAGLYRTG